VSSSTARKLLSLKLMVGSTPTKCYRILGVEVCFKLEYANPTGSHKDRIAVYMIEAAIREQGSLDCVAEVSSGNTATSVAWAAGVLGLKSILFVEKRASEVKKSFIRYLGGILVEIGDEGLSRQEAIEEAARQGCLLLDQNSNEYNHLAHYEGTGVELLHDMNGDIDVFVMGIGTGGTITGVGRRLKEELGNTLVVGVTPKGSAIAGGGGADFIEGLSSKTVPPLFNRYRRYVDRIVEVGEREAIEGVGLVRKLTGLLPGPSTGAAFQALRKLVEDGVVDRGSKAAIIVADRASRYLGLLARLGG